MRNKNIKFFIPLLIILAFILSTNRYKIYPYQRTGLKWPDDKIPVSYIINPGSDLTPSPPVGWVSAVKDGFEMWNEVSTSYFEFLCTDDTSEMTASAPYGEADGHNVISWNRTGDGMGSEYAIAYTFYDEDTNELTEFDVEYNGGVSWTGVNIQSVAVTMAGACLGLTWEETFDSVMRESYEEHLLLSEDDKAGITALYPDDGEPIYYIKGQVFSEDSSTGVGEVLITLSGDKKDDAYTITDGYYEFLSLSEGTYSLTPYQMGYSFYPDAKDVTVTDTDIDQGVDFERWSSSSTAHDISTSGGGGSCFIATAAFGTPVAEEVKTLSEFRDNILMKTVIGRNFIKVYYKTSPPIANFIRNKPSLRALVRVGLKSLLWLSKATTNKD